MGIFFSSQEEFPVGSVLGLVPPEGHDMMEIVRLVTGTGITPYIDYSEIFDLFTSSFFELTPKEAVDLAIVLNIIRVTKPIDYLPSHKPLNETIYTLQKLYRQLPNLINYLESFSDDQIIPIRQFFLEKEDFIKHLKTINSEIISMHAGQHLNLFKKKATLWHYDAMGIGCKIKSFGKKRNIELSYKPADSLFIKIITTTLARASNIHVSPSAVTQAFRRCCKQRKDFYK